MMAPDHDETCQLQIIAPEQGGSCTCGQAIDIGDEKTVQRRRTKGEKAQAAKDAALAALMASVGGRAWLFEKLMMAHVYSSSFNPNALVMAFREGERSIGNAILADLVRVSPDNYQRMNTEAAHGR